ncbi:MAG: glycosyltransferase family 2 protein [Candidatus Omnitrophica bacterium]|nr:glycosyltransferase family 2 protein [Candidatus Omnitrophota bacterium]
MNNVCGKKISVIMPAYNEASNIKANIEETIRTFDDFKCDYEIIVVDDGSNDDTYKKVKEIADALRKGQVLIKRNHENFGKGRALKKGARYINGDYVIFLDADMDLHPGQIATFFDIMELTEADIVIGSKLHPNSHIQYPLSRRIISTVYYAMIKLMFGLPIHDTQTGLKLFKAEVLRRVMPKILIKDFAYDLEILANAHKDGFKIEEAPVILISQRFNGRIGMGDIWRTWWDTLAIFYRMYVIGYYDKIDQGVKNTLKPRRSGLRKKRDLRERIVSLNRLLIG